jgi:GDPmannose 4,6-dehydratase
LKDVQKRALVLGVDGQDGSYLTEFLIGRGYQVIGGLPLGVPRNKTTTAYLGGLLELVEVDLGSATALRRLLETTALDEIYNLASPSSPGSSWEDPFTYAEAAGFAVVKLLEAVRLTNPRVRFYQASSSELFGSPERSPQDEGTPFRPRNPYGTAKLFAHWSTVAYRNNYHLFAVNGILFNHESPRRGETFVTRKITRAVARIKHGLQEKLYLGNLDSRRDWRFAGDFVEAMWLMLQAAEPDDYVIATGGTHSVREFCQLAFACAGVPIAWRGRGAEEQGIGPSGKVLVEVDPRYLRPPEVEHLFGDSARARAKLGWAPRVGFEELVRMMVEADLERVGHG